MWALLAYSGSEHRMRTSAVRLTTIRKDTQPESCKWTVCQVGHSRKGAAGHANADETYRSTAISI